jgi:probable HAF family extracellular repeat protein
MYRNHEEETMNPKMLLPVALLATLSPSSGVALGQQAATPAIHYEAFNLGTPLGGTFATGQSVSLEGFVAGYSTLPGDATQHVVLWRPNGTKDLGTFGGPSSVVFSNVSGYSETATPDPLAQDFCETGTHLTCLAFTVVNQSAVALPTLGGTSATAYGNNDLGQVVGISLVSADDPTCLVGGKPQAPFYDIQQALPAVWQNGKVNTLPLPAGDSNGSAYANNDVGQIVGSSGGCVSNLDAHALLWQNGNITNLGNLGGAQFNQPAAINNLGQITGGSDIAGDQVQHAFLWQKGVMQDLGTLPGDFYSFGSSINNLGQIVGYSCDINDHCRAFLWQNGSMADLNTLNASGSSLVLNYAANIDDLGVITGYAFDQTTKTSPSFVAIPRPGGLAQTPRTEAVPRVAMPASLRTLVRQRVRFRRARGIGPSVSGSQN